MSRERVSQKVNWTTDADYGVRTDLAIVPQDSVICIVGPLGLQNSLLATFLEHKTGAACQVIEKFGGLAGTPEGEPKDDRLILWDCFGKSLHSCLLEYETNQEHISSQDYVALFNLSPGLYQDRCQVSTFHILPRFVNRRSPAKTNLGSAEIRVAPKSSPAVSALLSLYIPFIYFISFIRFKDCSIREEVGAKPKAIL